MPAVEELIRLDTDHSGINYQNDESFFEGIIARLDFYSGTDKLIVHMDFLDEQARLELIRQEEERIRLLSEVDVVEARRFNGGNLKPAPENIQITLYSETASSKYEIGKILWNMLADIWVFISDMFPFFLVFHAFPLYVNCMTSFMQVSGLVNHKYFSHTLYAISYLAIFNGDNSKSNVMPTWGPFEEFNLFTWNGYLSFVKKFWYVKILTLLWVPLPVISELYRVLE